MDIFGQIFVNLNTWLVVLATGTIVWMLQQVVPANVVSSKWWKIVLRLSPILLGGALSAIPGIRPLPVISQSILVGVIGGSFSSTIYQIAREAVPRRMKAMMGSKASREKEIGKDDR